MSDSQKNTFRAIATGIASSLFLSSTFSINSLLAHTGGHWAWTACLRSWFMIPILGVFLLLSRQILPLVSAFKLHPGIFLKWGLLGFGGLYTCIALASLHLPGWLIAAVFHVNILAGVLLSPFIYSDHRKRIPRKTLSFSLLIVLGVAIMQLDRLSDLRSSFLVSLSFLLVLLGAVLWPLANRKLLLELGRREVILGPAQRVLGLTLGSIPLLICLAGYGFYTVGLPSESQTYSSFYSAVLSGFLGGVLFYKATQMVKFNPVSLATVEATQVLEILFTLIVEMWLIGIAMPGDFGLAGIGIICLGILIQMRHSIKISRLEL